MNLDELDNITKAVSADFNKLAIIVGAGCSKMGPTNLPSWDDFIKELVTEAKKHVNNNGDSFFKDSPLLDEAEYAKKCITRYKGNKYYYRCLRRLIPKGTLPNMYHKYLSLLPNPLVITTNYDKLLDKQFIELYGVNNVHIARDYTEYVPGFKGPQIIKLHGCISRPARMIVTRSDYDKLYGNPLFVDLLKHFLNYYNIVMLGFSMNDPAFRHIFGASSAQFLDKGHKLPKRWLLLLKDGVDNKEIAPVEEDHNNLSVVPLLRPKENSGNENNPYLVFLKKLIVYTRYLQPNYRVVDESVERKYSLKDGRFCISQKVYRSGVVCKENIKKITENIRLDFMDSEYRLNGFKVKLLGISKSKFEICFDLIKQDSEANILITHNVELGLGDAFDLEFECEWSNDGPMSSDKLESFFEKMKKNFPDKEYKVRGNDVDENPLSFGYAIRTPVNKFTFTVKFPESYGLKKEEARLTYSEKGVLSKLKGSNIFYHDDDGYQCFSFDSWNLDLNKQVLFSWGPSPSKEANPDWYM